MWIVEHFDERFFHNLCSCFNLVFAHVRVITKTRNKFDEIVPVAQHDLSWIWTCSQVSIKFSYWENLMLFWMTLNKASAWLETSRDNIYITKSSPTNSYLFKVNYRNNIKPCQICSKLTIVLLSFLITCKRISHIFLVMTLNKQIFCWVPPYQ